MNIYVSGLNANTKDGDLQSLFAQYGNVSSAKVINDKFTGSSRGFAFVEMPNDTEAQEAISRLDNSQLDGKNISVKVARPKEDRSGSYPARGNGSFKKF